jgi:peptidoglycan-associated lipoprotein
MKPSTLFSPASSNALTRWMPRLGALLLVAALGACSSVKLDDVAVEDRNAVPVGGQAGGAGSGQGSTGAVDPRGVTGVQVGQNQPGQPPAGVARVVYFDYDSFAIKAEFNALLEAHARYLKADNRRRIALEGHTDERGGREYNLALGQKRAEAVRRALTLLGVSDAQMEAVSFGKEKPAANGSDEAAFAQNRRVEITYR